MNGDFPMLETGSDRSANKENALRTTDSPIWSPLLDDVRTIYCPSMGIDNEENDIE